MFVNLVLLIAKSIPKSPKGDLAKPAVFQPEPRTRNQEPRPAVLLIPKWLTPKPLFLLFTFYFLLSTISLQAQLLTPLSHEMNRRVEYEMMKNNQPFFTVLKPYVDTQLRGNARQDSLNLFEEPGTKSQEPGAGSQVTHKFPKEDLAKTESYLSNLREPGRNTWVKRKLFHESFIQVDSGDYYLFFDPVFELGLGKEISGRNTYINTRGFRAGGRLGNHFAFGVDFYENLGSFNSVVAERLYKTRIAPGEGIARKTDTVSYDFAHATGYVSVVIVKNLNIKLAQGRQFLGDGYRSILLSDASYTYPFFNVTWVNKRFLYTWSNMLLQDIDVPNFKNLPPIRRKSATMHMVGVNLPMVQLSVIKLELYKNPDSVGRFRFEPNQMNPFLIPLKRNNKNSIIGTNLRFSPFKQIILYNQIACINPFSSVRQTSIQLGGKIQFEIQKSFFHLQAEYNKIPPLAYSSGDKIYNWEHLREPITHPYGNNFKEQIFSGIWNYKRFQVSGQATITRQLETISNLTPFKLARFPYFENGKKLNLYKAEVTYFLNAKTLINLTMGVQLRKEHLSKGAKEMELLYFSFGTRLFNRYYDF